MRIIMLGAPGAGKGTQARFLSSRLEVPLIASGDLFRRHQQEGTPLGLKAMEYVTDGLLVPDDITIAMTLEELSVSDDQKGFILDGFPRNLHQAQKLDEALTERGMKVDQVILLDVSQEKLVDRLAKRQVCPKCQSIYHDDANPPKTPGVCDLCGVRLTRRADDDPVAISKRLEVYQQETAPLIDFYQGSGKLVKVDGVGTVDAVRQRIEEVLENRVSKARSSS